VGAGSHPDREPGATSFEGRALRRVLEEIDDIAEATLGSITLATMQRLVEEQRRERPEEPREGVARAAGQRRR
jgi:hypothetical protein